MIISILNNQYSQNYTLLTLNLATWIVVEILGSEHKSDFISDFDPELFKMDIWHNRLLNALEMDVCKLMDLCSYEQSSDSGNFLVNSLLI